MTDRGSVLPAPRPWRRVWIATAAGVFVAVAVPVLWAVLTQDVRYTGDMALIELRIRDVFSAEPPIAGAYSRYGWAHPGPWHFYLFALPYRLLGADAQALRLTTLAFNLGVAATIVWLAARRDRATATVVGLGLLALVAGLRPLSLAHGWNVTVTVLPFVLVAVGCWRALSDDRWAVPITVASTVFVAATHVGVGVVVAPVVIATATSIGARRWRNRAQHDGVERVPIERWATAAVVAAAAAPIVGNLLTDPPGNIARLVRWSLANDEPRVGLRDSLRMVGRSSSLSFLHDPQLPGLFFLELGAVDPGILPGLSIALLVSALVGADRRGWTEERRWCAIVAGLWATGIVAAAVITEPLGWWLVQWLQPLGWLTWTAIALVGWRYATEHASPPRRSRINRWAIAGCVVVAATAVIDHGRDALDAPERTADLARPVSVLADGFVAASDGRSARLDFAGAPLLAETMLSGLVNELDRRGVDVCVDEQLAYKLGAHRVCDRGDERRFVVRVEPRSLPAPPGTERIAASDPLSTAERAEAERLAATITEALVAAGRDDLVPVLAGALADVILLDDPTPELGALTADVRRLAALRKVPGDRYALYAAP